MRRSLGGLLALSAVVALSGVSGCSTGDTAGQRGDDKVEVFSWWSGVGEEEGLNALVEDFSKRNPGIQFINASVAGGAGANARSVLEWRMAANDPPDSYQAHAGRELASDVKAGRLQDLSSLYAEQKWEIALPTGLLDAITMDGKIYSVPVNVHRMNLLWYNPKVLAAAGISGPPKTWTEFLTQTATFKAVGITPIAVGPLWTQKQLLETILLGELGAEVYKGLWNGKADWRDPKVQNALVTAGRVFANSDVRDPGSDWQAAMAKTVKTPSGGAAYTITGDWAYTQNLREGLKYKTDFDVVLSPGSEGTFDFMADSFTLPKGAPHPGAAKQWLIECGSIEGQDLFNPVKGAVSPRTDTDPTKYTGFMSTTFVDWRSSMTKIVGSLAYGTVVSPEANAEIGEALSAFTDDRDPDKFTKAVLQALEKSK